MNPKIFLIALVIILFSNSFIIFRSQLTGIPFQFLLLISLFLTLILWYIFLKKDIPIELFSLQKRDFSVASPIFTITVGAIAIFFTTDEPAYLNVLLSMFMTALIVGAYEEIIFRAIILKSLIKSGLEPIISIFLSAIIFSIFHMAYVFAMGVSSVFILINTFMMGVFLAVVYSRTKNILFPIGIHTLWNFTTFINQALPSAKPSIVLTIILLATAVLYFNWSIKKIRAKELLPFKEQ